MLPPREGTIGVILPAEGRMDARKREGAPWEAPSGRPVASSVPATPRLPAAAPPDRPEREEHDRAARQSQQYYDGDDDGDHAIASGA